jgi:hypothetical protein
MREKNDEKATANAPCFNSRPENVVIRHFQGDRIEENAFIGLLGRARSLAPQDPMLSQWNYSPWCTITFDGPGGRYSLRLFLGGLGRLVGPDGNMVMLLFSLD